MKYLALLRGINVGGNNIIKKDSLKACFLNAGFKSVTTYIQSGNVLFHSHEKDKEKIIEKVRVELKKKLKKEIKIIVYTKQEFLKNLAAAHKNWGSNKDQKHNALFLLEAITPEKALKLFPEINRAYEELSFTDGMIFWSGSKEYYSQTTYAKELVKSPIYKMVTIRNSKTSLKLKDLLLSELDD